MLSKSQVVAGLSAAPAQPGAVTPEIDAAAQDKLPLSIDKRPAGATAAAAAEPSRFAGIAWRARFAPLFILPFFIGGIVGLYFQPPGLQFVMARLGLQPGGGTRTPAAVPVSKAAPRQSADPGGGSAGATVPATIAGLGKLVPKGKVMTLAPPYGAGDSRIAALLVNEGDRVERGAILAIMDNERGLKAAITSAQATLEAREATLNQVREQTLITREETKATLAHAEAAVVNAKRDFDRSNELRAKGYVAESTFDTKRSAYDQAVQDVAKAKATLSRFAFDRVDEQADVVVAASNVAGAKADLDRAEADLDKAYVRAPTHGTVLTINGRPGEKPGSTGIMNFGNIDEMTAEIEVYQTQVGGVVTGAPVTITADALPRALNGQVTRVGLEVGKQTATDASPAANTDARVVTVYVDLPADDAAIARRFTNLLVTARIAAGAKP